MNIMDWLWTMVVGFLQPYLYTYIGKIEAQARTQMPDFFPAAGGIAVPSGREVEFVSGVVKALLHTIQVNHGAKA